MIALPVANRTRQLPLLEYDERKSEIVVAPTVMESSSCAGKVLQKLSFSLPVATLQEYFYSTIT